MKLRTSYLAAAAAMAMAASLAACDEERDLIIIEESLPIKTSALYMVGDATPNGWSIDSPTALDADPDDAFHYSWEGQLRTGEMKFCLQPGSWDVPFIRPAVANTPIDSKGIAAEKFAMHAGDPDDKWRVAEAGCYRLDFDLRARTFSAVLTGEAEAPSKEPIEADALYIVGDATAAGWNIDSPIALDSRGAGIFVFEGPLTPGELKACTSTGSWDVPFVRPESADVVISRSGVAAPGIVYTTGPDDKWRVADAGTYRLTFDLTQLTIAAEFLAEPVVDNDPIETESLFIIGDATPGGWSMDDATAFTVDAADPFIWSWEGELTTGTFKACLVQDGTFSCPFIRPASADVTVSSQGVAEPGFVFTTGPDDQWRVAEAGRYRLTFDLRARTIAAEYLGGKPDEGGDEGDNPEAIETESLFMIGDATPGGWSMDNATAFTADASDPYIWSWEGNLTTGEMKACLVQDGTFSCPFIRPLTDKCSISAAGVEDPGFIFTAGDPDNKWLVAEAGRYSITFNLKIRTIEVRKID